MEHGRALKICCCALMLALTSQQFPWAVSTRMMHIARFSRSLAASTAIERDSQSSLSNWAMPDVWHSLPACPLWATLLIITRRSIHSVRKIESTSEAMRGKVGAYK
ncbi:hypothetical protein GQ54DRAFT_7859 [Martensiomyces pterosporus]|nr:hypothetical protein GQ54DRAFT_7859 [Martensiomyces pterosporus]